MMTTFIEWARTLFVVSQLGMSFYLFFKLSGL